MKYFVAVLAAVLLISCGGGGNGVTVDLSCAPSNPSAAAVDLNGTWTLMLTETSSTCDYPPDTITCNLTFSVSGNDVRISGTCTSTPDGVTVVLDDMQGIISGSTFYWGATMSATVDQYSETDTVPCTSVTFTSTESEIFNVTVQVQWSDSSIPDSDTCSTSFTGQFVM
jgi:hypothetical protein